MEDALLVTNTGPISGQEAIELGGCFDRSLGGCALIKTDQFCFHPLPVSGLWLDPSVSGGGPLNPVVHKTLGCSPCQKGERHSVIIRVAVGKLPTPTEARNVLAIFQTLVSA